MRFVAIVTILVSFLSCKFSYNIDKIENSISFIPEIHKNDIIIKADSLAALGYINSATEMYSTILDSSESLLNQYCVLKLVQINYYNKFVSDSVIIENKLFTIILKLKSCKYSQAPFLPLIQFYLDSMSSVNRLIPLEGFENFSYSLKLYLTQSIFFLKGEYYKSKFFQLDSSLTNFENYQSIQKINSSFLELYWSKIRLSQLFVYKRDHLSSISIIDQLLLNNSINNSKSYKYNLLIHKSDLLYRFDYFKEAESIVKNVLDSIKDLGYNHLYQKTLKSLLIIYIHSKNKIEFKVARKQLENNIDFCGNDYVNCNKLTGRYFYELNQHDSSIIFQEKALEYCLKYEAQDIPSLSTLCYLYSESLEKLGQTKKAIDIFLKSTPNTLPRNVTLKDLVSKNRFAEEYYYVILTRIASIYLTDYKINKKNKSLEDSKNLAEIADSLIQKYLIESNEDKQLSFLNENRFIVDILKEISLIKFEQSKNQLYLFDYINYFERTRTLTDFSFSQVIESANENIKLNQLKIKSKRFLLYDILDKYSTNRWSTTEYDLINIKLDSLIKSKLRKFTLNKIKIEKKLLQDSAVIFVLDNIDTNYICIQWTSKGLNYSLLPQKFMFKIEDGFVIDHDTLLNENNYFNLFSKEIFKENKILIIQNESFNKFNFEWYPIKMDSLLKNNYKYVIEKYLILNISSINRYYNKQFIQDTIKYISGCFWTDENTLYGSQSLPELPGGIKEKNYILQYFKNTNLISGLNFNKQNLLQCIYKDRNDVFHLSTHTSSNSKIRDDIKIYMRSPISSIDSIYAFELLAQSVKIKNAVLVSCETSLGKSLPTQSSFTLCNYLLQTGTNFVISSTDLLSDIQSAKFCELFYKNLKYHSFDIAYRETKLNLLKKYRSDYIINFLKSTKLFY